MKSRPRRRLDERPDGIGTKAQLELFWNNSRSEALNAFKTSWSADLILCSFAASNMFFATGEYGIAE
jgi:hypothetical protein